MKSPLKAEPLSNAGDSVENARIDMFLDEGLFGAIVIFLFGFYAILEWVRYFTNSQPHPFIWTAIAIFCAIFYGRRVRLAIIKNKRMKLGADGEKVVGQFLESLRAEGAIVFHDVPGNSFNLDHVVIHETGIYVIETKTYSKPDSGHASIIFDGSTIKMPFRPATEKPIIQCRAATSWLREQLLESTGQKFPMRSVVTFPGWFVEPTSESKGSEVWVLNTKVIPSFIENSRKKITPEQVKLASYHLSRYIRSEKALERKKRS